MWLHPYVAEKLRALDDERLARIRRLELREPESGRVLGWAALVTGRILHRVGEGLESWASPSSEPEERHAAEF